MFGGGPGGLAKYYPAKTGWVLARYTLKYNTFFQGVADLLPASMAVERMKILSAPALMKGAGVDYALMAKALSGHIAFGMNLLSAIQIVAQGTRSGNLPEVLAVLGVKDREAADAFLESIAQLYTQETGNTLVRTSVAGEQGYALKLPDAELIWVRKDDAILGAFSSAMLENASNHWKGQNLTTRRGSISR